MSLLENRSDAAGVRFSPPGLLGVLLATAVLQRVFKVPSPIGKTARWLGLPLVLLGLLLGVTAVKTQMQAGTSPDPHHPSTALVDQGPYRYTRNPIYLGFGLLAAGVAFLLNAVWTLPLVPVYWFTIDRTMVQREEAYLERRFGDSYLNYKGRVRRWI